MGANHACRIALLLAFGNWTCTSAERPRDEKWEYDHENAFANRTAVLSEVHEHVRAEPIFLSSLMAAGCTQGALGGVGQFKATTSTLSKAEINTVLQSMKQSLATVGGDVKFKKDEASIIAAWDFNTQISELLGKIDATFAKLGGTFDFSALEHFNRAVEPAYSLFFRNFHQAHHVQFLGGGRARCSEIPPSNQEKCSNANADVPSDFPASLKAMYEKPCEVGEKISQRGTNRGKGVPICLLKTSLQVIPWSEALRTRICSGTAADNGKTCLLLPGAQTSQLAQSLVQERICAAAAAATPEEALASMRAKDEAVFGLLNQNSMLDAFTAGKIGGAAAMAISDTASTGGSEAVHAIRTSTEFNHNAFTSFGVTKASAMVCQVAVAQVLHSCPTMVQQVVVNAVQPLFSVAGDLLAAGQAMATGALSMFGGGSSGPTSDQADANRQTCSEATTALSDTR